MTDHEKYWDIYVQQLTYTWKAEVQLSTILTPFSLVLTATIFATAFFALTALPHDTTETTSPHALQVCTSMISTRHSDKAGRRRQPEKKRNGATEKTRTRGFAMRQTCHTSGSTCTSTKQQWQPLQPSYWRPVRSVNLCPQKLANSESSKNRQVQWPLMRWYINFCFHKSWSIVSSTYHCLRLIGQCPEGHWSQTTVCQNIRKFTNEPERSIQRNRNSLHATEHSHWIFKRWVRIIRQYVTAKAGCNTKSRNEEARNK